MGRFVRPPSIREISYDPLDVLRCWREEVDGVHSHRLASRMERLNGLCECIRDGIRGMRTSDILLKDIIIGVDRVEELLRVVVCDEDLPSPGGD